MWMEGCGSVIADDDNLEALAPFRISERPAQAKKKPPDTNHQ
jgi:hypothetical protein